MSSPLTVERLHWQGLGPDVRWTMQYLHLIHRVTPTEWYAALAMRDAGLSPSEAAAETNRHGITA